MLFFHRPEPEPEPDEPDVPMCPTEGDRFRLLTGDALTVLQSLPTRSVQTCITSPPYWGLRDYNGITGQVGLEATPEAYVAAMVAVFREVRRVLRDDGTLWLNLGDSYATQGGSRALIVNTLTGQGNRREAEVDASRKIPLGFKVKDLIGIPWRVALALQADGWYLRSDIIWSKPNPMPESVQDRPTKSHEYLFLLAKSEKYFYDADAIRETHKPESLTRYEYGLKMTPVPQAIKGSLRDRIAEGVGNSHRMGDYVNNNGHNKRSVWTVVVRPYPRAHYATFPKQLVEPCVRAGTSAQGACVSCGAPWERVLDDGTLVRVREGSDTSGGSALVEAKGVHGASSIFATGEKRVRATVEWAPSCGCKSDTTEPCLVLDPFCGTGTVGEVALDYGQAFIGIDLDPKSIRLAAHRMAAWQYEQVKKSLDKPAGV